MLSPGDIQTILPVLIGLPILSAIILWSAKSSPTVVRQLAVSLSLLHLVVTGIVVYSARQPLMDRYNYSAAAELTTVDEIFSRPTKKRPDGKEHTAEEFKRLEGEYQKNVAAWQKKRDEERQKRFTVFQPLFVPGSTEEKPHATTWTIVPLVDNDPKISGIQFFIGLDGLNIWLLALTSLMTVPIVCISLDTIKDRVGSYFAWIFLLQAGVLGVFLSFDVILFYVFFELTLIPLFFLIGNWGVGSNRRESARKLFLITLGGGLITLLGIAGTILVMYNHTSQLSFSIPELAESLQRKLAVSDEATLGYFKNTEMYLFLALAVGFAVKIPVVPFHTWLPGAYSDAPIGVTMMLSALLAKMGTFGLLRLCLPLAPDATLSVGLPILGTLAGISILYAAFCAYAQNDIKRLVAYSSISHLGFCVLALLAFNAEGIAGGTLHMVNHGLSTGALFLLVGYLTTRYTSLQINDFSGLWNKVPLLTFFMMVMCLASVGLPGLCNFVSEMLMLGALFDIRSPKSTGLGFAVVAAAGIFLGAWYTITLLYRTFFGPTKEPMLQSGTELKDLRLTELLTITPIALICLLIGIAPQPMLDTMKRDVDTLARIADASRERMLPLEEKKLPAPVEKQ